LRKQKEEPPIGQKDRRRGIEDISAQQPVPYCDDNRGRTVGITAGAGGELKQKQRQRECIGDLHDDILRHIGKEDIRNYMMTL
jgi:hypothetical protein